MDSHRRHAVNPVGLGQLARLICLRLDRERIEHGGKFGCVDAVFPHEGCDVFDLVQPHALVVDSVKDLAVHGLDHVEAFQCVVDLLMGNKGLVPEGDWNPAEIHVGGQFLDPCLDRRLEGIAVRAAVPEKFDRLDLAGRHRLRLGEADIVLAFDRLGLSQRGQ